MLISTRGRAAIYFFSAALFAAILCLLQCAPVAAFWHATANGFCSALNLLYNDTTGCNAVGIALGLP